MKKLSKLGNPEFKRKVEQAIKEAGVPVGAGYVGKATGTCYITARAVLADMVLKGKLKMLETISTPLFMLSNSEPTFLSVGKKDLQEGDKGKNENNIPKIGC